MYFHGEEQSLTLRSFTKGWDIYHPKWIPLYHLYKKAGTKYETHHWSGDISKQRDFDCPDEIKYLSGEDIDFDINFVASRIYFFNNSDIWNKFFRAEIEDAEEKMGFCFG